MEEDRQVPEYCRVMEVIGNDGSVKQLLFPKGLDLDRPKRPRTTFSDRQLRNLEHEFQRNPYLVGKARCKLAVELGLSETQVKVWFQNRRTKTKKLPSKCEHEDKLTIEQNNNEKETQKDRNTSLPPPSNLIFPFDFNANTTNKPSNMPIFPWLFGVQNEQSDAAHGFSLPITNEPANNNQLCSTFFRYQ